MENSKVKCPSCSIILEIPANQKIQKAKCAKCNAKFILEEISYDDIMNVLGGDNRFETSAGAKIDDFLADMGDDFLDLGLSAAPGAKFTPQPTGVEGFTLTDLTAKHATFEIDAKLLEEGKIRGAMPTVCTHCGTMHHLSPKLVVFANQLMDCATLESEYMIGDLPILLDKDLQEKPMSEILKTLPTLRRIPMPANKPFVYWICDQCSPTDIMFAKNDINWQTHEGVCTLQINRIWRAQQFLENFAGTQSPAYEKISQFIAHHPESPWSRLPGSVQKRIVQWYKPHKGEEFTAYIPDRRRTRNEDGIAGVLITNRRFIYNSSRQHFENIKGQKISITLMNHSGDYKIGIKGSNWEIQQMNIDKDGLKNLRKSLIRESYEPTWR